MLQIRPLRNGSDLSTISRYLAGVVCPPEALSDAVLVPGLNFCALDRSQPVAAAGILRRWGKVGVAWMFAERLPRPAWLQVVRESRRKLDDAFAVHGFERIEATVISEFGPGHRLMDLLGLAAVAELRKAAADGRDLVLYERLAPEVPA